MATENRPVVSINYAGICPELKVQGEALKPEDYTLRFDTSRTRIEGDIVCQHSIGSDPSPTPSLPGPIVELTDDMYLAGNVLHFRVTCKGCYALRRGFEKLVKINT